MANIILAYPNRAETATLSGGGWSANAPLAYLQDRFSNHKARTLDLALANTQFDIAVDKVRDLRYLGLSRHNMTRSALWRMRAAYPLPDFDGSPWLDVDIAGTGTLDPAFTVMRAGNTATYYDRDGLLKTANADTPRIGYDPKTGACLGLMVESASTNRCTWSENFANWTLGGIVPAAGTVVHPRGSGYCTKLEDTSPTGYYHVAMLASGAISSGQPVCASILVAKDSIAKTTRFPLFRLAASIVSTVAEIFLDTSTGEHYAYAVGTGAVLNYGEVYDLGRFWLVDFGCTVTDPTLTSFALYIFPSVGASAVLGQMSATATGSIEVAWAQIEYRKRSTSYMGPTTGAPVSRAADSISLTGAPFTSIYRQEEGTLVFSGQVSDVSAGSYAPLVTANDGTTNNRLWLDCDSGTVRSASIVAANLECLISTTAVSANTRFTVAAAFRANSCAASVNGSAVATDTTAKMPTPTQLILGSDSVNYLDGFISRLSYFPRKLNDAGLVVATTSGISSLTYSPLYDSGWCLVWPAVYSFGTIAWGEDGWWGGTLAEEDLEGYPSLLLIILPTRLRPSHIRLEFSDPANPAGYIEAARLWMSGDWQPTYNYSYGAGLQWLDQSVVESAFDGTDYADKKPLRRVFRAGLDHLPHDETYGRYLEMTRRLGITDELLVVPDANDPKHLIRRSFIGKLRQLSPAESWAYGFDKAAIEIMESV